MSNHKLPRSVESSEVSVTRQVSTKEGRPASAARPGVSERSAKTSAGRS